jgi:hypothetical protein
MTHDWGGAELDAEAGQGCARAAGGIGGLTESIPSRGQRVFPNHARGTKNGYN